jgi:hypothetical protein
MQMKGLTKITEKQLSDWQIPAAELERCIVERGEGFVRVDGEGECWRAIVTTYLLPRATFGTSPSAHNTWGPDMWEQLHKWAMRVDLVGPRSDRAPQEWLALFSRRLPCGECIMHWTDLLKEMPPDFSSNAALFEWSVRAHNAVNARLCKPVMSFLAAAKRWEQPA